MACACKVNQEIDRIHRYYSKSGKRENENKARMTVNAKDAAITLFIYFLLLPLLPVMILYVIGLSLFGKNKMISMRKFLGFIHTVRNGKQQQIV